MQLVYRGQTYNAASAIDTTPTEITGQYRGQTLAIKAAIGVRPSENIQLSYRGIRYTHNR